ncbi:MAG: 3-dehydroquinate synthase [Desulfuromonadales bacterium]|nr:3-dehydroquinate synthase [Desulfuromonadales bacterium]
MLENIQVSLGERSYPIDIGVDSLDVLGSELAEHNLPRRMAIISNPTINAIYGKTVYSSLLAHGFTPLQFDIPDGEEYKTVEILQTIYDFLISNEFDRGCGIIALGGGVVGDIAGFAAATFLRGIPYVQIPTTLLAQVDSSVGGKTAVNHDLGKNLIGAFYQPELVFIDIAVLDTLEYRDFVAGIAEIVKYGVIRDYDFFCWLENNVQQIKDKDREALMYAINKSCCIKAEIVAADEREGSVRAILNYGHTFGHAIEKLSGYGEWKHGEAVSVGMVVAAKISCQRNLCSQLDVERICSLLKAFDLPTESPSFELSEYVASMRLDKKVKQGDLTLVLNSGIGDVVLQKIANIEEVFSTIL